MSYLTVPTVPEPPALLRPLLREAEAAPDPSCDEGCFVAHVDRVVRSAAARAWAKLDENSDGQLDLEEWGWEVGRSVGGNQWGIGLGRNTGEVSLDLERNTDITGRFVAFSWMPGFKLLQPSGAVSSREETQGQSEEASLRRRVLALFARPSAAFRHTGPVKAGGVGLDPEVFLTPGTPQPSEDGHAL
eukprot:Skav213784  [mRNA]  locus=scaffold1122:35289:35852:- [translate_table: standard]